MTAKLYIVCDDGTENFVDKFSDYREAVLLGQSIAPRSFTIDTGNYVPSREEQLLLDDAPAPRPSLSKKTRALTLED